METVRPTLSDGVIILRPPVEADAPALVAAVVASAAELSPFMPWASPDYDETAALAWIRGERDPDEEQYLIIGDDGEVAGGCGLGPIDRRNHVANLGYWLRSDRTGRGWATRATRLLARHALTEAGMERVEIVMAVENEPSRRVAERAGATFEGTMRRRFLLHGRQHDAHLFSLVRADLG